MFSKAELARRTEEARPVLERLAAAGCRFMQLEMPDNNGILRGKLVPLSKGLSPAGSGIGTLALTVKSGDHIAFNAPFASASTGFRKMVAIPDVSTAVALPWKRDVAAVLCDYYMEDGSPCPMDVRHVLRGAEAELAKLKYAPRVALEYELYIVQADDALMRAGRYAELPSFGRGWDFMSLSKAPPFEDFAKEFMTRCAAADIHIEVFHTELGPGMFEYTFEPAPALKAANDSARAKLYLKELCAERGLAATYMAAKFADNTNSCTGCHHNFSLVRESKNAFWEASSRGLSPVARQAAAGILATMPAFNILYRPWVNSFRRMDRRLWNPEHASWGMDNHVAALRVVHGSVPEKLTRFEHRAPGSDINSYITIASIVFGALHGIREQLEPPAFVIGDAQEHCPRLPHTMVEAVREFRSSPAAVAAFGSTLVENYAFIKQEEWEDFAKAVNAPEKALKTAPVTDWELMRYFNHA